MNKKNNLYFCFLFVVFCLFFVCFLFVFVLFFGILFVFWALFVCCFLCFFCAFCLFFCHFLAFFGRCCLFVCCVFFVHFQFLQNIFIIMGFSKQISRSEALLYTNNRAFDYYLSKLIFMYDDDEYDIDELEEILEIRNELAILPKEEIYELSFETVHKMNNFSKDSLEFYIKNIMNMSKKTLEIIIRNTK